MMPRCTARLAQAPVLSLLFLQAALFFLAGSVSAAPLDFDRNVGFTDADAAHLLRRAGFSATPEEVQQFAGMGREKAVDTLIFYEEISYPENAPPFHQSDVLALEKRLLAGDLDQDTRARSLRLLAKVDEMHMQRLRDWWIERMVDSPRPLEEKMTLFWHGHFTSGYREVQSSRMMLEQNRFLRDNALSRFKNLLRGISRDGAMLRYLDNSRNVKSSPNENYARELMELFTLGEGNYSEKDVRETARAFTGWGTSLQGFRVDKNNHDRSNKTIFGARGHFNGDHVISLLLLHPQSSRYIARKLWEFFVAPNPDSSLIDSLAIVVRESKFNIRNVLRTIFLSDAFYDDRVRFAKVKSPVELVVGAVRMLDIDNANPRGLYLACKEMGQDLFQPPNVKGWDGERTWITSTTLLARYNFGDRLLHDSVKPNSRRRYGGSKDRAPVVFAEYDPASTLRAYGLANSTSVVRHYVNRLLQRDLPPDRFEILLSALREGETPFDVESPDAAERIRALIFLISSMPEFQLI